jgi:hypothetical protein
MAAKLTKMTHKIAIQLHLVAESCTICSSHSRRLVQKLLDTPSHKCSKITICIRYYLFITNCDRINYNLHFCNSVALHFNCL